MNSLNTDFEVSSTISDSEKRASKLLQQMAANKELPDLPNHGPVEQFPVNRPPIANELATNAPLVQDRCPEDLILRLPAENDDVQILRRDDHVDRLPVVNGGDAPQGLGDRVWQLQEVMDDGEGGNIFFTRTSLRNGERDYVDRVVIPPPFDANQVISMLIRRI